MRNFILLVMSMACAFASFAQARQLKGKIVDEQEKTPLPGANILVNNLQEVVADNNGEFTIDCSDSVLLKVSYTGYSSVQKFYKCAGSGILEIALKPNAEELETVEVT